LFNYVYKPYDVHAAGAGKVKEAEQSPGNAAQQAAPPEDPSAYIIGNIVEKPTVRSYAHEVSPAQQASVQTSQNTAFPPVHHRKQSKFSLARKQQTPEPLTSTTAAAQVPALPEPRTTTAPITHSTSQARQQEASDSGVVDLDESAAVQEIKAQNDEFISRLTPVEVCAAMQCL
jgi:hypothetical protein